VFSVSAEEDLLTWAFPFCKKSYLTPPTWEKEEGRGEGCGMGSGRKEKIRLMLKKKGPYCAARVP